MDLSMWRTQWWLYGKQNIRGTITIWNISWYMLSDGPNHYNLNTVLHNFHGKNNKYLKSHHRYGFLTSLLLCAREANNPLVSLLLTGVSSYSTTSIWGDISPYTIPTISIETLIWFWQRHLNCIPSWFLCPWVDKTIKSYVQHRNDIFRSHYLIEWKAVGITWQWITLLSRVGLWQ